MLCSGRLGYPAQYAIRRLWTAAVRTENLAGERKNGNPPECKLVPIGRLAGKQRLPAGQCAFPAPATSRPAFAAGIVTGQKLYAEIPSSLSESDFQNNPTLAASNWKGVNGRELNEKLLAAVQGELKYGPDLEHQISLFYNYYRGKEYRPFNDLFDSNRRLGIRSLLSYDKKRLALQFVLEAFREWYRWETYQPGQDQLLNRFRENRSPLTLALQAGYSLSPKCYLEAGLSANFLQYRVEDLQSGSEPERFAYPAMWSPFLGLNYAFSEEWAVYGSVGHGFSYPSVQETLLPEGEKNPDLRPETGLTGELGLRYAGARRRWAAELGLYHMQLSQMLVTERLPNGDGFGSTQVRPGTPVWN